MLSKILSISDCSEVLVESVFAAVVSSAAESVFAVVVSSAVESVVAVAAVVVFSAGCSVESVVAVASVVEFAAVSLDVFVSAA